MVEHSFVYLFGILVLKEHMKNLDLKILNYFDDLNSFDKLVLKERMKNLGLMILYYFDDLNLFEILVFGQ